MADYIRREDALFALRKAERGGSMTALTRLERAYAEIREMPAADVAEVVHGRWLTHYRSGVTAAAGFVSSCCDMWAERWSNYCPYCGAKMSGGEEIVRLVVLDAVIDRLEVEVGYEGMREDLYSLPVVDAVQVVHARWKRVRSNWYCTGCNKGYRITKGAPMASGFSYCPNCGAKMDGAAE